MPNSYYTYRIIVSNYERVQIEKSDSKNDSLGEGSGKFRYQEKVTKEVEELLKITRENKLNNSDESRLLGEALFDVLFDDGLCYNFVNFYTQVVREKKQLLRVELKIDEQSMPKVVSLPWEFMCVPKRFNSSRIWLGTSPNLVFSRYRSQWTTPEPIQLNKNERLRIALVVSAPTNLGAVAYETVLHELEGLAKQEARVELLPLVNPASAVAIDAVLAKEPHIFHFIGHGRLENENHQEVGEIAFVNEIGDAAWVDAGYFSDLLNRHRPSIVILQACEGGKMSTSQAFVGVASSVLQQNIPVVVAMQYEVSNSTANHFSRRFYAELAKGSPVDIAAQEGRRAIALSSTQYKKRDFATPIIFMCVPNGYLFQWSDHDSTVKQTDVKDVSIKTPEPKLPTFEFDIATIEVERSGLFGRDNKLTINRRRHQAEYFSEDLGNKVGLEMVAIPGCTFTMGSPETETDSIDSERPQHQVIVNPFFMGKYPITQAQWQAVAALEQIYRELNPDPSNFKGSDRPVEQVSWYDVVEFCDRLAKATGRDYRLPSEAQWEYACRAGTNTPFHFGETITTDLANYDGTDDKENKWSGSYGRDPKGIYRQETTSVGKFEVANIFGLSDMHGNVLEWCADEWHENYQNAPSSASTWNNNSDGKYRMLRGASWIIIPRFCRSAFRSRYVPEYRDFNLGFRVVVSGARTV